MTDMETLAGVMPNVHTFCCNFARLPLITEEVYNILCTRDEWISEQLPLEFLDYYVTALLWARLIGIKHFCARTMTTTTEERYVTYFEGRVAPLPEPIYKFLMMIGNICDPDRGWQLYLSDHRLPVSVIQGRGGYHAVQMSRRNHNLFEEIPSLGVSGDCIMCLASMGNHTEPLFPFLPDGTQATVNMVGYFGPASPLTERVSLALKSFSISADKFKEEIRDTRLNAGLIEYVSGIIRNSRAFRLCDFSVSNMSVKGSETQLIQTWPLYLPSSLQSALNLSDMTWTQQLVQPVVFSHFNPKCVLASCYAGFQLYKEEDEFSHRNWCCIKGRGSSDAWTVPEHWVKYRNSRRNGMMKFWEELDICTLGNVESQRDATRDYCREHEVRLPTGASH